MYSLSNGIVTRELTFNATTGTLSTTAVVMTANQTAASIVATVVPEASFTINEVPVQVGGLAGQVPGARMARFHAARPGLTAVAGGYAWIPGVRGSNPDASWPPKGTRTEFDHVLPCAAFANPGHAGAGAGAGVAAAARAGTGRVVVVTVPYEQYDGTSGFSRRVVVAHNCSGGAPLRVAGLHGVYLALVDDGHVELQSDTEASIMRPVPLADGTRAAALVPYDRHAESVGLASGDVYQSYLMAEIFHSTAGWDPAALGGVDRYARESARFWRLVTPQIEQMVVYVQGICTGGNKERPGDGQDGSVGYWCYDDEGTAGIELLIDQAKEMGADMLVFGQNMNTSWRSMIAPEFNSRANLTWFSRLVARAHNTSQGQSGTVQ